MAIPVLLVADDNFAQHACVTMASILSNTQSDVRFILLDTGLSKSSRENVTSFVKGKSSSIDIQPISLDSINASTDMKHVNKSTYARIFCTDYVSNDEDRIIYIDADTIFVDDIVKLYKLRINNCVIGAVRDPYSETEVQLDSARKGGYFNAGVMLVNTDRWRDLQIKDKCMSAIVEHHAEIVWWDQDVLNSVVSDNWFEVGLKWNVYNILFSNKYLTRSQREAIASPGIIHFNGSIKPWMYKCNHPAKNIYYKYLKETPYRDYIPEDRNTITILRKVARKTVNGLFGHE
jgi:lipopolysaccharide biosynthesis glycosyltransferase